MRNFGEQLYSNYLTYAASLLRKCTKLYNNTAITINNNLAADFKKYATNSNISEIEDIYKREFPEKLHYKETISKIAILSQIFSREFVDYMQYNHEEALLSQMFNGQFKDNSDLKSVYEQVNLPLRNRLQQVFDDDLKRLKHLPATGRILIESYDEAMARFKLKHEREYRFVTNPLRETK
jgi:hypothetical protein